jgi:hypothetical protein
VVYAVVSKIPLRFKAGEAGSSPNVNETGADDGRPGEGDPLLGAGDTLHARAYTDLGPTRGDGSATGQRAPDAGGRERQAYRRVFLSFYEA